MDKKWSNTRDLRVISGATPVNLLSAGWSVTGGVILNNNIHSLIFKFNWLSQLRIEGHILKYGMNLKFETIV